MAATYAAQAGLPMVVDAVGVAASSIRKDLVTDLFRIQSQWSLKGNMSGNRSLVGLKKHHRRLGSMRGAKDQETEDLLQVLKDWCQLYPGMSFFSHWPQGPHRFQKNSCCIEGMAVQNWTG